MFSKKSTVGADQTFVIHADQICFFVMQKTRFKLNCFIFLILLFLNTFLLFLWWHFVICVQRLFFKNFIFQIHLFLGNLHNSLTIFWTTFLLFFIPFLLICKWLHKLSVGLKGLHSIFSSFNSFMINRTNYIKLSLRISVCRHWKQIVCWQLMSILGGLRSV